MVIGAAVENLLIAAQGEGLGTCWLGKPLKFSDTIRKVLGIPADEDLVTCVSLGHPDNDAPINNMERSRLRASSDGYYWAVESLTANRPPRNSQSSRRVTQRVSEIRFLDPIRERDYNEFEWPCGTWKRYSPYVLKLKGGA